MPSLLPGALKSSESSHRRRVSWCLRDAAQEFVEERQAFLLDPTCSSSSPAATAAAGGGGAAAAPSQKTGGPLFSRHFDTSGGVDRLTQDKHILPAIFDLAASTVLQAIRKQQEESSTLDDTTSSSQLRIDGDDDDGDSTLPNELLEYRRLQQVRIQCLERSHENKEYSKRKGAKIDPEVQAAEAAAAHQHQVTKKTAPVVKLTVKASPTSLKKKTENTTMKITTTTLPTTTKVKKTTSKATAAASTTTTQDNNGGGGSSGGPKKFTRNTPASSAAALDFRFTSSRAILCAAGNLAFAATTPGPELEVVDVPQNPNSPAGKKAAEEEKDSTDSSDTASNNTPVNMGEVVIEAQNLGQRTISVVENVVRRAALRYQYRKDNARYNQKEATRGLLHVPNPFDWKVRSLAKDQEEDETSSSSASIREDDVIPYNPQLDACTEFWRSHSLPRFLSVLQKGAGHAVYFDLQWSSRHGRIADLLKSLSVKQNNFGPHLIVTTEPEVVRFAQEFHDLNGYLGLITTNESKALQVLAYQGTKKQRRALRQYFSQAAGLPESPFHVLVTSYSTFLEDYLHFCQLPFDSVVLDEGLGWLAAAYGDQNSSLRSIWETAIFSTNDQHIGLAGTSFKEWDFSRETFPESIVKDAWVGLTTRHRIVTASTFMTHQRTGLEPVSVSCLVGFLAPHFTDVVREEWDRSRIFSDMRSMKHFRVLVARSTIVHAPNVAGDDMDAIVVDALLGKLGAADRGVEPQVPRVIPDEEFVSSGKVAPSRRWVLNWLGAPETSWMRYELGRANFLSILDVMKLSDNHGHFCEEITTASSTTTSGANGQVAGSMAYRLAVRCGRHFGSEQGLRQHVSAMHAPPMTWLCRTCSTDCITSQARTHHERTCGQPLAGRGDDTAGTGGASPIVGQGGGPKSGVGKKKSRPAGSQKGASAVEEKDPDGSFRVPGYRGVWINKAGKHFVKIDGKRYCEPEGSDDVFFFDGADDAGKKYDELVKKNKTNNQKLELNFKPDGSRIVYEDITPASTSGLGGSAASVVPALSVINIKDLPPDVKPLLRDPRMTSRTGGNSKRHVYAYRGVCRQARKGHDRWQSQISFMGQNHYLGTFDSEWDAAAIYAWAHLILYGEEATRQAQKEGEEAAAAYEQEKRDIAAGKIPIPTSKPEKKKRSAPPKKKEKQPKQDKAAVEQEGTTAKAPKKRKRKADGIAGGREKKPRLSSEKKGKASSTTAAKQKESITPILAKGVTKALALSPRGAFESVSDDELVRIVADKMKAARQNGYVGSVLSAVSPAVESVRPCIQQGGEPHFLGMATLLGISPASSGWDLQAFVEKNALGSDSDAMMALQMLAVEYDEGGVNERFTSIIQGTVCIIGCASKKTQRAALALGLDVPTGGSIGKLDCHIGGVPGSCSEASACIRYAPTADSDFQFACLAPDDIVTMNGRRLNRDDGCVPLQNGDICSVGARVFSFIVAVGS